MTDLKLEKGTALVLCGPPGSGKTTLARSLADAVGESAETDESRLLDLWWVNPDVRTLIVDGLPETGLVLRFVKNILALPTVRGISGRGLVEAETPYLIFCTQLGAEEAAAMLGDARRFNINTMPQED